MNKKAKTSPILVGILVSILVAVIAVGVFIAWPMIQQQQIDTGTTDGESLAGPTTCADSTGILTVNARSALVTGETPTGGTTTCGINGGPVTTSVTSGTTTFAVGSELECLYSNDSFIDKSYEFKMPCGGKVLDVEVYYSTSDNPSIQFWNDDGDKVTDSVTGAGTNQTSLTAGESLTMDVDIQGTATESSGELISVIELAGNTDANISSMTLSGCSQTDIPSTHSRQATASYARAFECPAVVGAAKDTRQLNIVLKATKDLSGGVYTDWYGQQEFIDDDKTISFGVEDSDGTAKYENTLDFDFFIDD